MIFQYQALDKNGDSVSDFIDAQSETSARRIIRGQGLYLVNIKKQTIEEAQAEKKKGTFLGEGALDQDRLMKQILDAGYDGWLIIECRKEGVAPADYLKHASDYIRSRNWAD